MSVSALAFLYCHFENKETIETSRTIGALLQQLLLLKLGSWTERLQTMLTEYLRSGLISASISSLIDVLSLVSESFKSVFFVLDGLDECSEEVQVEIQTAMQK